MSRYDVNAVYFSPNKTTAALAGAVCRGLSFCGNYGAPVIHDAAAPDWIEQVKSGLVEFGPQDVVVFAAPVYSGRIPALAAERFAQCRGQDTPAVVLAVYGNRAYDDALLELKDLAEANGFKVVGAAALVAEHCMAPEVAKGRPDNADKEKAAAFGKECGMRIGKLEPGEKVSLAVPGNSPYRPHPENPMPRPLGGDDCTACQECARNCPTQAIKAETPRETGSACIACCRCITICPVQARAFPQPVREALGQKLGPLAAVRREPEFYI